MPAKALEVLGICLRDRPAGSGHGLCQMRIRLSLYAPIKVGAKQPCRGSWPSRGQERFRQ